MVKFTMQFKEPNYTQIPNELLGNPYAKTKKRGMMARMTNAELRVTLAILRSTLGYHRGSARVSVRSLATLTGLSKQGVLDGALRAEKRGLIIRHQDGGVTEWAVDAPWVLQEGERVRYFTLCPSCGHEREVIHGHHIIPKQYGGKDRISNITRLCTICHTGVHTYIREKVRSGLTPCEHLFRLALESMKTADTQVSKPVVHPVQASGTPSKKETIKESDTAPVGPVWTKHPAVLVFKDKTHYYPGGDWNEEVAKTVGEDEKSLALWEQIVFKWIGLGWSKRNVIGMLEAFKDGGIKDRRNTNKSIKQSNLEAVQRFIDGPSG